MEKVKNSGRPDRRQRRADLEQVLTLSAHLAPEERVLIDQIYREGLSIANVARLRGRPASTVRTQVQGLIRRIHSPAFWYVVSHGDLLPKPTRTVGQMVICQGMSQRAAAIRMRMSLHAVRKHVQTIQALVSLHAAAMSE